jgi:Tol biopolymer transport system component
MKNTRTLSTLAIALVLASHGWAQVTRRISVSSSEHYANDASFSPAISGDGLSVAFDSEASNLGGNDSNGTWDVFCRDWLSGQTEIDSVDTNSIVGNFASQRSAISADGHFVAFESVASNLVTGDTNVASDVFIRSRVLGTTQRVSVSASGAQGDNHSFNPALSADGRYVAFRSSATNLVAGDTNAVADIFVRDRLSATTERISVSDAEAQSNGNSHSPAISADGRYVAFVSSATNLVSGDTAGFEDIFVRDRVTGTTVRASVNNGGAQANGNCANPSISADGRFVAFDSLGTNLIGPLAFDQNGFRDVFVRDLVGTHTSRVSLNSGATQEGNGQSSDPSISSDGRYVAFGSSATNLVPGDTNGDSDVFVYDRSTSTAERVSLAWNGAQGNDGSQGPSISGDGRFVAFWSHADNVDPSDSNDEPDVFLRDRVPSGFTSVCHPGVGGVIACPCGNPPSVVGRGCNNSAATGGAFLTASGQAYLSADSLVFTTFAEKPTALSILLQGKGTVAAGEVYGQGVRCVGGTLKRLFTKTASSGSITAPGVGDLSVSAQSAAKGDTIQAGRTRWYLVYYRDGQILGGCPSTSTFNATQTGRITWMD